MDKRALIDERIRTLLTSTDLTFKQIIEQLRNENMPASFNTIRRVNRNHRYRKPRYDAKLTPQQRKELIVKLKNTTRPNLSSLARQYGVCHGSIWYWWDKLSKIREKNGGQIPNNEPSLDFDELIEQDFISSNNNNNNNNNNIDINNQLNDVDDDDYLVTGDPDSDPLDLDEDECFGTTNNANNLNQFLKINNNPDNSSIDFDEIKNGNNNNGDLEEYQQSAKIIYESKIVGPVQAKDINGEFIRLPIIMYAPLSNTTNWNNSHSKLISKASSSSSSTNNINNYTPTPSSSAGQAGSLSKRLGVR